MNLKDYTNAVKDNKKALEINPNNKSARINLSAVINQIVIYKMDSKNYHGEILDFTKSLKDNVLFSSCLKLPLNK
jgi:hypothetical protein